MPRKPRIPSYRLHRASGQAVVTIANRDHYLGPYGSPESRAEYARLLSLWTASGGQFPPEPSPDLTVSEVLAAYWRFAQTYYRQADPDTGELLGTQQLHRVRRALGAVRDLFGATEAARFGPLSLQAVRQRLIAEALARSHVNQLVSTVKRCFKWAASNELVPAAVFHGLQAVEGLKAGRSEAIETEAVQPVPEEHIEPVQRLLLPTTRDLVELQLLTAARPGELLSLRPADVDRSGPVWIYRPRQHKTGYRGHQRQILIGPMAQTVLARYLLGRAPETYCFSPREGMLAMLAEMGRKLRVKAGDRYSVASYSRAVRKACRRAGIPEWHPHQLRHSAATRLVAEHGFEVARIILGHRSVDMTKLYAADELSKALDVIRRVG